MEKRSNSLYLVFLWLMRGVIMREWIHSSRKFIVLLEIIIKKEMVRIVVYRTNRRNILYFIKNAWR